MVTKTAKAELSSIVSDLGEAEAKKMLAFYKKSLLKSIEEVEPTDDEKSDMDEYLASSEYTAFKEKVSAYAKVATSKN